MHIRHGFGSVHHVKVYDQEHFLGFLSLQLKNLNHMKILTGLADTWLRLFSVGPQLQKGTV